MFHPPYFPYLITKNTTKTDEENMLPWRFSSWAVKLTAHLHIALKLEMLCPIPTLLHIISFTFTSICASLHFPVPSNFTVPKFFPP